MEPFARSRSPLFAVALALCLLPLALLAGHRAAALPTAVADFQLALAFDDGNILHIGHGFLPTNLTADWKVDDNPTFSPDGQQVAFVRRVMAIDQGQWSREIFRVGSDGQGLLQLSRNALAESGLAWSPDGARIAFVAAGDLYVLPAAGGAAVRLTGGALNPRNVAWSPDSARLAFNSWPCPAGDGQCPAAELYVVTLAGQLTRLTNDDRQDARPAWSPDGARLVYEYGSAPAAIGLALLPVTGGTPTTLVTDLVFVKSPAWSPDGFWIAFFGRRGPRAADEEHDLFLVRPDGSQRQQFDATGATAHDLAWTADSGSVVYRSEYTFCGPGPCDSPINDLRIQAIRGPDVTAHNFGYCADAPRATQFAWSPTAGVAVCTVAKRLQLVDSAPSSPSRWITDRVLYNGDPAWSPDGDRVAYSSRRDFNGNVYVVDVGGGNRRPLTTHPANDWNPAWAAGGRIAFTSDRDGNWELYLMDADGSGQTNLTHTPEAENDAAWSPDGARLAFARQQNGNWDIWVMDANGAHAARLTSHSAADRAPAWSPDGARLAFQSDRDGNDEVYVLTLAGAPGNETNLTRSPDDERDPAWRPDGATIAFSRPVTEESSVVYQMPVAGGEATMVAAGGRWPQAAWRPWLPPRIWTPLVARAGD